MKWNPMFKNEAVLVAFVFAVALVAWLGWNKMLQRDLERHLDENAIIHPPMGEKVKPIDPAQQIDRQFIGNQDAGEIIYITP